MKNNPTAPHPTKQPPERRTNMHSEKVTARRLHSLVLALCVWMAQSAANHQSNEATATRTTSFTDSAPVQGSTADTLSRQLRKQTVDLNTMYAQSWADGVNQEWDDYQQAWRLLGFFIDCDDDSHWHYDDDAYVQQYSGSGDEEYTASGCPRYVLWAAYVDPEYQGGGIGEYQFWNRDNQKWDATPCNYNAEENGRCAKMDCHTADTHWQLLGLYKHRQPDDWMEQLFKHEGVCVWNQEQYAFMKNARKAWPKGCAVSDQTTLSGRPIYYAMAPGQGASMKMGMYTDEQCTQEYSGVNANVEQLLGNFLTNAEASHDSGDNGDYDFSGWSLSQALKYWQSSMEVFTTCQPCIAYDLNNVGFNGGEQGSSYGTYQCEDDNNGYDDWGGGGGGGCVEDDFDCYDDAGYTNVNQCMKFRAKTYMDPATLRDVLLAQRQGTLVETAPVAGIQGSRIGFFRMTRLVIVTMLYAAFAIFVFVNGLLYLRKARKHVQWPTIDMKKPLVFT